VSESTPPVEPAERAVELRGLRSTLITGMLLCLALIVAGLVLPPSAVDSVRGLYPEPPPTTTPYSRDVADVDAALREGRAITLTPTELDALLPELQARRLTDAGPMSADEVDEALRLFKEYQPRLEAEPNDGGRDALRSHRNTLLDQALPRVERQRIDEVLATLQTQIERATAATTPGGSGQERHPSAEKTCIPCHSEAKALPASRQVDFRAIWPHLDPKAFGSSAHLPILMDGPEFTLYRSGRPGPTEAPRQQNCTGCHAPHGEEGWEVTTRQREEAVGFWMNVDGLRDVARAQIKVQNYSAGHRVPGGSALHAYVVVIEGFDNSGARLPHWWGLQLPEGLRTVPEIPGEHRTGMILTRSLVDATGQPTGEASAAADVLADNRLAPRRFVDEFFLLRLPDADARATLRATLWYVPDKRTWKGAEKVRVIEKELR
jgi:hypothetical protein